jgi:hypothetical protein
MYIIDINWQLSSLFLPKVQVRKTDPRCVQDQLEQVEVETLYLLKLILKFRNLRLEQENIHQGNLIFSSLPLEACSILWQD